METTQPQCTRKALLTWSENSAIIIEKGLWSWITGAISTISCNLEYIEGGWSESSGESRGACHIWEIRGFKQIYLKQGVEVGRQTYNEGKKTTMVNQRRADCSV